MRDLDPEDWAAFRSHAHAALDAMVTHLETIRQRPVWVAAPAPVRQHFVAGLPLAERPLDAVLAEFETFIKPYATGNTHPAFMGWVHGAGTPVGMLAEMLSAGLNANCGGRDHVGLLVERQITLWMRQLFGFPEGAAGLFVTGSSMANFVGLQVARTAALGEDVRRRGLVGGPQLCAYGSEAAHGCIAQAMQLAGFGADHLRLVACGPDGALRLDALRASIAADRAGGLQPFLVVGTAGTVDTGAIDPLADIATLCAAERLWFHVDGAFGALAAFAPSLRPLIAGIERADSIAFDFHKWAHVPYDAGFLLVRDGEAQRRSFAASSRYLTRAASGLAAGEVWPCDLGPDLSRGFRALKTWMTLQVFGIDRLGAAMVETCRLARHLAGRLEATRRFAVLAPVTLNIVCFSLIGAEADRRNRRIVEILHDDGSAAPSITLREGQAVIRCAILNHRTNEADIDAFLSALDAAATQAQAEA